MTVTCNIYNCPYYAEGFCSKATLNLYDGRCEVVYNKKTRMPQHLTTEEVVDKAPVIVEDYQPPQQQQDATNCCNFSCLLKIAGSYEIAWTNLDNLSRFSFKYNNY